MLLLLGAAAAATATWWFTHLQDQETQAPTAAVEAVPDQSLEGIVLTAMDANGQPQYRLYSPRMAHFKPRSEAVFETPRLLYYRAEGTTITLDSESAVVSEDGKEILLRGNVSLEQPASLEQTALSVATRNVKVRPEDKTISTAEAVTAKSSYYLIDGQGMRADLANDTIEILSAVKGIYEPENAPESATN